MDKSKMIREWGRNDERERFYAVTPQGHLIALHPNEQLPPGFRLAERADLEAATKLSEETGGERDERVLQALIAIGTPEEAVAKLEGDVENQPEHKESEASPAG